MGKATDKGQRVGSSLWQEWGSKSVVEVVRRGVKSVAGGSYIMYFALGSIFTSAWLYSITIIVVNAIDH